MTQKTFIITGFIGAITLFVAVYALKPLFPQKRPLPFGEPAPYNILWISIESLQADHLGCYGYHRDTSPHIDAFAETGVLFEQVVNASCWTSEAMVSDFTGVFSPVHGVETRKRHVPPAFYTPIEILRDAGYEVPILQGYQADANYSHLGFTGTPLAEGPVAWLKKNKDTRFFLWYHILDTHLPYKPKPWDYVYWDDNKVPHAESRRRIGIVESNSVVVLGSVDFVPEEDQYGVRALYDGCLRRADRVFQRILDALDETGLREHTIVVLTADHGEELLEHGFVGHASTSKKPNIHDEITHVPLILSFPDALPEGKRIPTQISKMDLMPTLFDLLGLTLPTYFMGESLLPVIHGSSSKDQIAFTTSSTQGYKADNPDEVQPRIYAVTTPEWKYILPPSAPPELYYRPNDKTEQHNVIDQHPEIAKELNHKWEAWLEACTRTKERFTKNRYTEPAFRTSFWQRVQQTLGFTTPLPDLTDIPSPPVIVLPEEGAILTAEKTQGVATLEWTGAAHIPYLLEFDIGEGDYRFSNRLRHKGNVLERKFDPSYWQEFISAYDPARIRVRIDAPGQPWSSWRTVRLE